MSSSRQIRPIINFTNLTTSQLKDLTSVHTLSTRINTILISSNRLTGPTIRVSSANPRTINLVMPITPTLPSSMMKPNTRRATFPTLSKFRSQFIAANNTAPILVNSMDPLPIMWNTRGRQLNKIRSGNIMPTNRITFPSMDTPPTETPSRGTKSKSEDLAPAARDSTRGALAGSKEDLAIKMYIFDKLAIQRPSEPKLLQMFDRGTTPSTSGVFSWQVTPSILRSRMQLEMIASFYRFGSIRYMAIMMKLV